MFLIRTRKYHNINTFHLVAPEPLLSHLLLQKIENVIRRQVAERMPGHIIHVKMLRVADIEIHFVVYAEPMPIDAMQGQLREDVIHR